jgi:hypothetical protein
MKIFFKQFLLVGSVAILALYMQGCVRTVDNSSKVPTRSPVKASYPKLKDYTLDLNPVVPGRPFSPDTVAVINFKLKNSGTKPVLIDEWYMDDSYNIRIYYRQYSPDIDLENFDKKSWKCINPELKPPVHHFPLLISPNNIVFVEKQMDLFKQISPDDLSRSKRFWVIAELALNSVDVRSPPFVIEFK